METCDNDDNDNVSGIIGWLVCVCIGENVDIEPIYLKSNLTSFDENAYE